MIFLLAYISWIVSAMAVTVMHFTIGGKVVSWYVWILLTIGIPYANHLLMSNRSDILASNATTITIAVCMYIGILWLKRYKKQIR